MNITIDNLPSKFLPFLLGFKECKKDIVEDIDKVFEKPLKPLSKTRDYVFDAGDWVLKLGRTDGFLTTPDTHLYRIRKAEKVRQYITDHHLENDLMVPEKYLYWNKSEKQFYVVAKKIDLSDEVATPANKEFKSVFEEAAKTTEGQVRAFVEGKPQRSLTAVQAKALAELSILGYTDLSYNNLYFTLDGRVAIIDTEPQKRGLNKNFTKSLIGSWLTDKGALLAQQTLSGTAKLKLYCDDQEALKEVELVEKNHALWSLAKSAVKIAFASLMIYAATFVSRLPIPPVVAKVLRVTMITLLAIKLLMLTLSMLSIYRIWGLSHQGLQGVLQIMVHEKAGHL